MLAASQSAVAFPILTALVVVPLIGAAAVLGFGRARPEWTKMSALVASIATGALSLWVLQAFDTRNAGFQFVSRHEWISDWGISWHLGVDGISLFLVVLTGVLFPLVVAGVYPHHDERPYLAWLLVLEAGVMGSFVSLDLFLFFVFFEIVQIGRASCRERV